MAETERTVLETLQGLLLFGFLAAMLFAPPLLAWLQDRRLRQAMDAPLDGSSCPACEGDHVTTYAADCHRCDRCGIEWGEGRAAHASLLRREALASRAPRERLKIAIAELRTAIAHLDAANALNPRRRGAGLPGVEAQLAYELLDSELFDAELPDVGAHLADALLDAGTSGYSKREMRQDAELSAQPDAERALEHIRRAADAWPECVLTAQPYPGVTPDAQWIASVRAGTERTLELLEHEMRSTQPPDR
jgi:hypothetical protein